MHPDQLAALEAIARAGTFEAAARLLGVSTSAVSQRIRALESGLGRILIRRGTPSTMTEEGAVVLRYARQQALLAAEMAAELDLDASDGPGGEDGTSGHGWGRQAVLLTVAVNADSLETWFTGVLRRAVGWQARLELRVADEARTAELLRSGQVMCAVSSSGTRVAGCRCERLGPLRYTPMVSPTVLAAHDGGRAQPGDLPAVRFDADDDLQDLALAAAGLPGEGARAPRPARASVPTAAGFAAAIEAGLGWGMLPPGQLGRHPGLVPVPGLAPVERNLFWHRWSIGSPSLDLLSAAVRASFVDSSRAAHSMRSPVPESLI